MQPNSPEEYNKRFFANAATEGFGLDTASVIPCPFCAAPRWAVVKILEIDEIMSRPHHCGECNRSAKMVVDRTGNAVRFEFFQTGGDPQPDWLEPKMRRVEG